MGIEHLNGTEWAGNGELWLDPTGYEARRHPCTAVVEGNTLRYRWTVDDAWQEGVFHVEPDGSARWRDSWHQKDEVRCRPEPGGMALVNVHFTWTPPTGPDWGWRIGVCERPSGELVLQMTNVTPWGEEARAVRMIFDRKG